jgi:hypothetical protein
MAEENLFVRRERRGALRKGTSIFPFTSSTTNVCFYIRDSD